MPHSSILVIESNAEIRRMIRNELVRQQYHVDPVENPEQAGESLASGRHRLILCSLDAPVIEFLTALRSGAMGTAQRALPIVAMAAVLPDGTAGEGFTAASLKELAQQIGLAGLIAKPITIGSLTARVAAVLPVKTLPVKTGAPRRA